MRLRERWRPVVLPYVQPEAPTGVNTDPVESNWDDTNVQLNRHVGKFSGVSLDPQILTGPSRPKVETQPLPANKQGTGTGAPPLGVDNMLGEDPEAAVNSSRRKSTNITGSMRPAWVLSMPEIN